MFKKICTILLVVVLLLSMSVFTYAAEESTMVINDERVDTTEYFRTVEGVTYVDVNVICRILGAEMIVFSFSDNTAEMTAEGLNVHFNLDGSYVVANDRYLYLEHGCYVEFQRVFLPLDVVCKIFGAEMTWDSVHCDVRIVKNEGFIKSGAEYYDEEDLYWLSHLINAESGGESLEGMIAVGNVVLNRVESGMFPNTIYGVIFDGVQFSTANSGAVYMTPNEKSVIAAKLVLDGAVVGEDCLFFAAEFAAWSCWAGRNRAYAMQIGNHVFFY